MSDDNQITANRIQRVSFDQDEADTLNKGLRIQRKLLKKPRLSPNGFLKSVTVAYAEVIIEEEQNGK